MTAPLKIHHIPSRALYNARPAVSNGYDAIIQKPLPSGRWMWESTLFGGAQGSGYAATLNEARDAVRRDYAALDGILA